jgi:hypothetical protein
VNPRTLEPHPSPLLGILGGLVGTLLATALLHVAPAFGPPFVDVPGVIGGLLARDGLAAFIVGTIVFFVAGTFAIPFVIARVWPSLPGGAEGLGAALVKGLIAGGALWLIGVWPIAHGIVAAIWLLVADIAYALAVTVIVAMAYNIEPIGTLGWGGYHAAVTPEAKVRRP